MYKLSIKLIIEFLGEIAHDLCHTRGCPLKKKTESVPLHLLFITAEDNFYKSNFNLGLLEFQYGQQLIDYIYVYTLFILIRSISKQINQVWDPAFQGKFRLGF